VERVDQEIVAHQVILETQEQMEILEILQVVEMLV
jgi:hypothetical protein